MFVDFCRSSSLPDAVAGAIHNVPSLDTQWIETTSKKAALKLEKLDTDLKNYKSNSIKESIRYQSLGDYAISLAHRLIIREVKDTVLNQSKSFWICYILHWYVGFKIAIMINFYFEFFTKGYNFLLFFNFNLYVIAQWKVCLTKQILLADIYFHKIKWVMGWMCILLIISWGWRMWMFCLLHCEFCEQDMI